MKIIALAGGIGAGKSVVSHILRIMGYDVYDTDSAARRIMDSSTEIKRFLREKIAPDAVDGDGVINRAVVAAVVFADTERLALLNAAVHSAVKADMRECASACGDVLFVESAVPVVGGIADEADAVWEVTAPEDLRVARICTRSSGMTAAQARARIAAQRAEHVGLAAYNPLILLNDGNAPLLPQVEAAIGLII